MTEHPCEGTGCTRVALAVLEDAIAGDHDQGMRDGSSHHLVGVAELNDEATLPAIALKRLACEPFAGRRPQQAGKGVRFSSFPPVVGRRRNFRHRRGVWIRLGCDIQTASASTLNHPQGKGRLGRGGAVDVHHVERRAGHRGIRDHLLQ